jgi:hypothetical protein
MTTVFKEPSTADEPEGQVLAIHRFTMWSTKVPTLKGWTFDTTTGPINFHANREQFEAIGNAFLAAARSMPGKNDLS